jgi:transposase-like protein
MIFFSVADTGRRLGIDAKTLRRWLAEAQLPLQSHPSDGRKKGVSSEHLRLLAQRHQRSLAPLSPEPQQSVPNVLPPQLAPLLALPETLCALQAQIAVLQQQVAELTSLLKPQGSQPVNPKVPARQPKAARLPLQPAPPASRARSAASSATKPPRKPVHVIPLVEYGNEGRYVVICPKQGLLPFEPDTPEWFSWVAEQSSFRFVGTCGHFTAHHEWRVPKGAWRAHRQIRNHSSTLRLAVSHELTIAVLEQAAHAMQAHLT